MQHTIEFEPTATGTRIHMRFAAPEDEAQREIAEALRVEYETLMGAVLPALTAQLDEEFAKRKAAKTVEVADVESAVRP